MIKVILVVFFAHCGLSSAGAILSAAPLSLANTGNSVQSSSQDSLGNYAFSYNENHATGGTSRRESGNALGQVVGSYSLGIVDGRQRVVNYVADAYGFRAQVLTNEPGTVPTTSQAVPISPQPVPVPVAHQPAYLTPSIPIAQPIAHPVAHPIAQPIAHPVAHPIAQPIAHPVAQPVAFAPYFG